MQIFKLKKTDTMTSLNFEKLNGLIPAVIQNAATGTVLMVGFMNRESLEITKKTGLATFYSRTRHQLWTKGETSGRYLRVKEIIPDCDDDTLLVKALPDGPVCHTGSATCFGEENGSPLSFLAYLQEVIAARKADSPDESYTAKLLSKGPKLIAKKVGEEAVEVALEAESGTDERLLDESADLIYHLEVLLASRSLSLDDVARTLEARHRKATATPEQIQAFKLGEKQWGK